MGNYVRATLTGDEYVLYEARISLWSQLPLLLSGVFWLVGAAAIGTKENFQFELVLLAVGLVPLAVVFLRYKSTELCITNQRIIANFGLFSRHSIEIKLAKVESVQLHQGILGRLFNYGSLIISGAGNPIAPVPNVANPLEFRRVAMKAHEHPSEPVQAYPYESASRSTGDSRIVGVICLGIATVTIAVALERVFSTPAKETASSEIALTQARNSTRYAQSKPSAAESRSSSSESSDVEDHRFKTYVNDRFGFKIEYPQSFVGEEPPENGDGMRFESPDGHAVLMVSGSNHSGQGLPTYYAYSLQSITGELGYHTSTKDWFVITWKDGDMVNYRKTFFGSASENSFTISHPSDERVAYDGIVAQLARSFRPGDLERAQ